jgi:hypothetical protein
MRRFILTSDAFTGEVEFIFNDSGLLESFTTAAAQLSERQQVFILKELPRELSEIQKVISNSVSAKLIEVSKEITFEMFWNRYDEKIRSSKKTAETVWKRMSEKDRNKAYWFIPKYFSSILPGVPKKYAETYLRKELWNN